MISLKSDVGMVRKLNEDYANYSITEGYKLYIVADGMGGHNAGDVASKMAVESIVKYISRKYSNEQSNKELLRKAVKYANKTIYNHAINNDKLHGMGTTVVSILITKDFIQVANIGDSSAYGIKNLSLNKLTRDHSLVQELLDGGSITEEEARVHPQKNIITRAVGTSEKVDVDIFDLSNLDYNMYLLCTDGLSNELTKEEIENTLADCDQLDNISEILVDIAKTKGGKDNITVMFFGGEV